MTEAAAGDRTPSIIENHVIVAGYGDAARQLVRVLRGSRIPYVITTLSPGGALEAEAEGLPVIRGDASKALTLQHAGIERAKMVVIADDDPATAHRIAAVARPLAPTARIVVRTRYVAEIEPLRHAGVDRVIAEELESVVQLFADVLRDYEIAAEEIEAHEDAIRERRLCGAAHAMRRPLRRTGGRVSARGPLLRDPSRGAPRGMRGGGLPRRRARSRRGAGLTLVAVATRQAQRRRRSRRSADALEAGDELELTGSADAFAAAAPLFRATDADADRHRSVARGPRGARSTRPTRWSSPSRAHHGCDPRRPASAPCGRRAPGCEECLRSRRRVGPSAPVHDLRPRRLLRLIEEQARHRASSRHRPPDHPLARAGRALGLVLRRRSAA